MYAARGRKRPSTVLEQPPVATAYERDVRLHALGACDVIEHGARPSAEQLEALVFVARVLDVPRLDMMRPIDLCAIVRGLIGPPKAARTEHYPQHYQPPQEQREQHERWLQQEAEQRVREQQYRQQQLALAQQQQQQHRPSMHPYVPQPRWSMGITQKHEVEEEEEEDGQPRQDSHPAWMAGNASFGGQWAASRSGVAVAAAAAPPTSARVGPLSTARFVSSFAARRR